MYNTEILYLLYLSDEFPVIIGNYVLLSNNS